MDKKGFTLVELTVVILIVGILAAAAIPVLRGRIESAKWSEAKAAMGTIATALRAYCSDRIEDISATPSFSELGFAPNDLDGTYFKSSDYSIVAVNYIAKTGAQTYTIRAEKPGFNPSFMILTNTGW